MDGWIFKLKIGISLALVSCLFISSIAAHSRCAYDFLVHHNGGNYFSTIFHDRMFTVYHSASALVEL